MFRASTPAAVATAALLATALGAALVSASPATAVPPGFPTGSLLPSGTLDAVRDHMRRSDFVRARLEVAEALETRGIPEADRLLLRFAGGVASDRLGQDQQASAFFSAIRGQADHPLQSWAAWFEARADLQRGKAQTALDECDAILALDADGRFAEECALLRAQAMLELGRVKDASEAFDLWASENSGDPRIEGFSLSVAAALESLGDRDAAVRRYRNLHIHHRLPTTGAATQAALVRLGASGEAVPELSDEERYARACSLRTAGQRDAAWALWCEVEARHPATGPSATSLGQRIDEERDSFLWGSQRYLDYAASRLAQWERDKDGAGAAEALYDAMTAYTKAGRWADAIRLQEEGVGRYPRHGRFQSTDERSLLLYVGGASYTKARATAVAYRDSSKARKRDSDIRLHAAYLAYKAADYDAAIEELSELTKDGDVATAAYFWRSRVHRAQAHVNDALADEKTVLEREPDQWYAQVVRSAERRRLGTVPSLPLGRDGRWPGSPPLPQSVARRGGGLAEALNRVSAMRGGALVVDPALADGQRDHRGRHTTNDDGWGRLRWSPVTAASTAPANTAPQAGPIAPPDPDQSPSTWHRSAGLDVPHGLAVLLELATEHGEAWPELRAVAQLARIGAVEIGGPLFGEISREIREAKKDRGLKKRVQKWRSSGKKPNAEMARASAALSISLTSREWLDAHAACGWIPGVLNLSGELLDPRAQPRTDENARPAWTLLYPAAFSDHVWRAAWREGIDPLLLLAVMRQESRFRHDAVSPVGALGLIQVMPATGSRVAAMLGAVEFHPEELLRPETNIRLGAYYLGQLMRRFPGQFPLAIASYNGGPHNVGRWLQLKRDRPMEEFVEEIGFGETKDYVKKVTTWYSVYADLYGRAAVVVPERTGVDHPEIIDF